MKRNITMVTILIGLVVALLFIIYGSQQNRSSDAASVKATVKKTQMEKKIQFSAWISYWDLENAKKELSLLNNNVKNLCHFAVYFDNQNKLVLPAETTEFFHTVKDNYKHKKWIHYITIVNDKKYEDGSFSLKDTEMLYQLLSSEESMDKHIQAIISLAVKEGYDGIEIDYEAIRNDLKLWKAYLLFCDKLYQQANVKGLKVRIVLESSTPFKKLMFPTGPEYVMMCYNLYGMHSQPGPKASPSFIKQLIKNMNSLPGKKNLALATGGFDWEKDGDIKQLTEIQAYSLAIENNVTIVRDSNSQCLVYQYEDTNGNQHEVWYADALTLNNWITTIQKSGNYGISIWRLGGNRTDSNAYFLMQNAK